MGFVNNMKIQNITKLETPTKTDPEILFKIKMIPVHISKKTYQHTLYFVWIQFEYVSRTVLSYSFSLCVHELPATLEIILKENVSFYCTCLKQK